MLGTLAFDNLGSMVRDTIFRIASITKVITAVAAMILVEECKVRLAELEDTVPAVRAITVRTLAYGAME